MMVAEFLAAFGYLKIPKDLILLSMEQELFFTKALSDNEHNEGAAEYIKSHLTGQTVMTNYLRLGRWIS